MDKELALILINSGTLIAIVTYGAKLIKFINILEFKMNLLWEDYEERHYRYERDRVNINDH